MPQVHDALVMGIRDYTRKCGFNKVVLGLSGGIDSAVTAALAVEALGNKNVLGVSMPSPFSSKGSVTDAQALTKNIGIKMLSIPITSAFSAYQTDRSKENLFQDAGRMSRKRIFKLGSAAPCSWRCPIKSGSCS